jgi:hypothetical protein
MDISIGELARLTGLPVKTLRYYSDIGLAPVAERSPAGYRRYDQAGLARVDELVGRFASPAGRTDDPGYRAELAGQLEMFSDRRVERYWRLIGVINGWPQRPSLMPAYEWFMAALGAQEQR